jgi:AcrR family transcriptional regulator
MGTVGWSGTTVRGVCQAARLNPRYFYESFDDLDALVIALYDRLVEELGAAVVGAIESAGDHPGDQTRAALDSIVGFMVDDPRRARVMYVEALGNESLNRHKRQTGDELVAFIDGFAKERTGRPEDGQVGTIGAAIVVGGTSELIVAWLAGRIDVSREELVDIATALFTALGRAAETIMTERSKH